MEQPTSSANPTPPAQNAPKKSGLLFLEVGFLEVGFVIVGLAILFGTLNYLNILPVSSSIPFLSFLPTQQKTTENKTQTKPVLTQEEIDKKLRVTLPFLSCPVEKDFCSKGIVITEPRGNIALFSGIGYANLTKDSQILAVIDGDIKLSTEEATPGALTVITIANQGRNIIVTYEIPKGSFKTATSSSKVMERAIIGTLADTKNTIDEFDKKFNLIFYSQAISSGTYIKLKPAPNGSSLLNSN